MPDDVLLRRAGIDEIFPLRHEILREGLPPAEAEFKGDHESTTWHFGAFDSQGRMVGCVTYLPSSWEGDQAWQMRGMAIARDRQRQGIGRRLLAYTESELIQYSGIRLFWCNARATAKAFYEKLGWQRASEDFNVPLVGLHCRMLKRIEA